MKRNHWLAALVLSAAPSAFAAGGHHAVDDASILQGGECEAEGWFTRVRGGERRLHAGVQCGVAGVELGVAAESARAGGSSQTGWGLELKWAREVADTVSVGVSVAPGWQQRAQPRHQGTTLNGLVTWTPHADWALHANAGRDFVYRGADENRYGASAEWSPRAGWTLMAERYREEASHFVRAGVRWAAGANWSVDFSRAHRLAGPSPSNWTLGVTLGLGG